MSLFFSNGDFGISLNRCDSFNKIFYLDGFCNDLHDSLCHRIGQLVPETKSLTKNNII